MEFFSRALAAVRAEPAPGALATVVAATGSTPRHLGARMMVCGDGRLIGSVGGGRIEHEVVQRALEVARSGAGAVVQHHLVRDLAMCCGGAMTVAIAPAAGCGAALEAVVAAEQARRPGVLETPCDGGAWRWRAASSEELRGSRRPRRDGDLVVELCGLAQRVVLFGAGHVGRAVGGLAASCGFEVTVCDDGDTGALDEALPWAAQVVPSFEVADAERALAGFAADDLVLIVTRDHAVDLRLLEAMLPRVELGFLGMIGSRGKVGRFLKRLVAKGVVDSEADPRWQRVAAPIGLDLGAETPAEIAVAVVAQLVAVRRLGQREPRGWRGGASGSGGSFAAGRGARDAAGAGRELAAAAVAGDRDGGR
jgi:xanthine dehydrogenase accessory factor